MIDESLAVAELLELLSLPRFRWFLLSSLWEAHFPELQPFQTPLKYHRKLENLARQQRQQETGSRTLKSEHEEIKSYMKKTDGQHSRVLTTIAHHQNQIETAQEQSMALMNRVQKLKLKISESSSSDLKNQDVQRKLLVAFDNFVRKAEENDYKVRDEMRSVRARAKRNQYRCEDLS